MKLLPEVCLGSRDTINFGGGLQPMIDYLILLFWLIKSRSKSRYHITWHSFKVPVCNIKLWFIDHLYFNLYINNIYKKHLNNADYNNMYFK